MSSGASWLEFERRLGGDWRDLATALDIPPHLQARFERGFEAPEIRTWVLRTERVDALERALLTVGREDLVSHVRAATGRQASGGAPVARSAYLSQVRRIAPPVLKGRDPELALLEEFCTSPHSRPYLWLRAEAWAGKSALMSWFALNPPPGTRLVCFFVTARFAGQSDRIAFMDAVVEQLAEILDEPVPVLTATARDWRFLDILERAADACRSRHERLILLIDGLDEDSGVTLGRDNHSIAALLPVSPPHGMKILVSGRPNPQVPLDVPDSHPLHDPAIIHPLSPSAEAGVVRADMLTELATLLRPETGHRDLVGLLIAAGGGLAVGDLAELSGREPWQVEEHLQTVVGRSFTPRSSGRADIYVLGHEELHRSAEQRLGGSVVAAYRDRIHAWAERYQERTWPTDTPEYLLRGYFTLLSTISDIPRMLSCATDPHRHARMLDLDGGDTTALTEITTLQKKLSDDARHLLAMGRLAVHKQRLTDRDVVVPESLILAWATIGRETRAEAHVRSIRDQAQRATATVKIAQVLIARGGADSAVAAAATMHDSQTSVAAITDIAQELIRSRHLSQARVVTRHAVSVIDPIGDVEWLDEYTGVAELQVRVGDFAGAAVTVAAVEAMVGEMAEPAPRVRALVRLASVQILANNIVHARTLVDQAGAIAGDMTDRVSRDVAVADLAPIYVYVGARELAMEAAASISSPSVLDGLRARIARALIDVNAEVVEVQSAVRSIGSRQRRIGAVALITVQLIRQRKRDLATAFEVELDRLAPPPSVLIDIARARRDVGDPEDPQTFVKRVLTAASRIGARPLYIRALGEIVEFLVTAGDADGASVVLRRMETEAAGLRSPDGRDAVVADLAVARARVGRVTDAYAAARSISDVGRRTEVLADVALAVAQTGDADAAASLADEAERSLRTAVDRLREAGTLLSLLSALVDAGDAPRVLELANRATATVRTIPNQKQRVELVADIARLVARAGHAELPLMLARSIRSVKVGPELFGDIARQLARAGNDAAARQVAGTITGGTFRDTLLGDIARILAEAGRSERAESVAQEIHSAYVRTSTMVDVAGTLARAGRQASATPIAQAARVAAADLKAPQLHSQMLAEIAWALSLCGQTGQKAAVAGEALAVAASITSPLQRTQALTDLAKTLVLAGCDHETRAAIDLLDQADQAQAWVTVARAAVSSGKREVGAAACERAHASVHAISNPYLKDVALQQISQCLSAAGHHTRALATAQCVVHSRLKANALTEVAQEQERARVRSRSSDTAEPLPPADTTTHILVGLRAGDWAGCLAELARTRPEVVTAISDEYLKCQRIDSLDHGPR